MTNARRKLMDQTQKSQRMLQEKLPDILNNKDCQEAYIFDVNKISSARVFQDFV